MSFATFRDGHGTFFHATFHSYALTVYFNCVYESFQFFFIFANNFMSSMYIRWLIFSCDLLSVYPAAHFRRMWFSGIMTIMNSACNRAIVHLLGKCLFGSLFRLSFFLLLSATISRFSCSVRWSLWLHVIFCTLWDSVLSSFVGPYNLLFCSQPSP